MKQRILLLLLFSFVCGYSFAQLSGGIRAGGNFSNVMGPEAENYKFKPGFLAGAYLEYDFHERFSFQTEACYSVKGFRKKSSKSTTTTQSTITEDINVLYNLSYIDVPLILNLNFGEMGSYLGIGPQISFLASAKWDGEGSNTVVFTNPPNTVNSSYTIGGNDKNEYNPVDIGVILGTGSKFENGLEYCLRGGYGLTNVKNPHMATNTDTYHNLVFSVTIGYAFGETSGSYVNDKRYKKAGKKRRH